MIYKASVFDLPGKLTPVEVGMKRDDAVPDINEVRNVFENKKPTNDESDDQVIDVRRHRNVYIEVGAFEESGAEKAETLFPDDQDVVQVNKPDQVSTMAGKKDWFLKAESFGNILDLGDVSDEVGAIRSGAQRKHLVMEASHTQSVPGTNHCLQPACWSGF